MTFTNTLRNTKARGVRERMESALRYGRITVYDKGLVTYAAPGHHENVDNIGLGALLFWILEAPSTLGPRFS